MRFPTGGKARAPRGMIRRDSDADSIVWMREEDGTYSFSYECGIEALRW